MVEILVLDRADQPLDERMRNWDVRNGFYFLELEYASVGEPTLKSKQRIVVRAEVFR